jgi:GTP-binding protein
MKPVLALVGRPNVGKSTLFNRLTKSRDAIVADYAGLTRDRHYGNAKQGKLEFIVIDTGGFEPTAESGIYMEMAKQTRQAVAEADVVVFVVDARGGLSAQDHDIAKYLRKLGKPTVLAANKAEGMTEGVQLTEFYELGLGEVHPVSAAHGQGIRSLVDLAFEPLGLPDEDEEEEGTEPGVIKLAVAGRPNVGKSTLFNRLTKSRDAIVADFAGLTRDRHYGNAKQGRYEFIVIDTGGFEPAAEAGIYKEMAKQTQQAVAEADVVVFLVDARAGVSAQDHDIARYLRRLGKPTVLAANKAEGMREGVQLAEFYELGLGDVHPVSAAHGEGIRSLVDAAFEPLNLPEEPVDAAEAQQSGIVRLAVAGRPNVGKSTLINAWLGEERLVAFDLPGTTRDAIAVPFERNGQKFELIDTAGLRRKGKVFEAIEKFSVVKTLQAIESANVVLLLLDATQGVTDQDAHIAGYILESGRAVVLAVNKWDAVDDYQRELLRRQIEQRLAFLKFAEMHFISATRRQGLAPVWASIAQAHKAAMTKMTTPVLTRLLQEAVQFQAPKRAGMFRPKLRYAHQGGMNPPVIVIHGNSLEHVTDAYRRFLEGRFRKEFNLVGTPMRIELKTSKNPYADKE